LVSVCGKKSQLSKWTDFKTGNSGVRRGGNTWKIFSRGDVVALD
jgi:hypothetical protein